MARMTAAEWKKKKEEEEKKGASESSTTSTSSSDTTSSGGSSKRLTPSEWKEKKASESVDKWVEASISLLNTISERNQKWFDETEYKSQSDRITNLLGQADNWRKQYANNKEAVSYINSVVDALSKAKNNSYSAYKVYSNYKSQEELDETIHRGSVDNAEGRKQRYEENKKSIEDLTSFGNEYKRIEQQYEAIQNGLTTDFKPENIPYKEGTREYWEEYRKQESAYKQDIIRQYKKNKSQYGSWQDIKAKIDALKVDNTQYERGEGGYVNKTVDDYSWLKENEDFADGSKNRDYVNSSEEEIRNADLMNESSTWYYDANGVYRDAYGNELAIDENGNWYSPKAKEIQVEDKLGLYLGTSKEQRKRVETVQGRYGVWDTIMMEGSGGWDYLTEGEIGIYYYLLDESQEKAYQYLDDMEEELNRRKTLDETNRWYAGYDEASVLEKIGLNLATVPAQLTGSITGFLDDTAATLRGEEINPYSSAHTGLHYSQTIRGATAEDLDELTGNYKVPLIDMGLSDIYQVGMSRLDSALATTTMGAAGTIVLGAGSATNEAYRLYKQGATAEQITLGALASGTAEALFEYVSFDKIVNMEKSGKLLGWVKNTLIQGGVEASEELATEVSNIISNAVIMGSQSDVQQMLDANGGDWTKTGLQLVQRSIQSAIGGFIGGISAGGVQAGKMAKQVNAEHRQDGKVIMGAEGGVDALKNLANEVAGVSDPKMQKSIEKQSKNVASEKATGNNLVGKAVAAVKNNANATKVGRLHDTVQTANNLNNASANKTDIAKSLLRKGFNSETAMDIADALVASYNGQELTKAQSKLLESAMDSKVVQDAISNIVENKQSTMGQRSQNIREFNKGIAVGNIAKAYGVSVDTVKQMAEGKLTTEKKTLPESHYEVSEEGKTIDKEGNDIVITGVESIENGKMVLKTENGTIDASDVSYATQDEALVYSAISDMDVSAETAWSLIQGFKTTDGVSAQTYAIDIPLAYKYGKLNYKAGLENLDISVEQRMTAFYRGRADVDAEVKANTATDTKDSSATVSDKSADKKIVFEGFTYNEKTAKPLQKASMAGIEMVNKMSSLEVHVYESFVKDGKRYAKVNGNIRLAPNGYFTDGNKIYIDINAGNKGEGMMLYTLGHEVGHYIKQWNAEDFKAISDFLFEHYSKDVPIDKLLEAQKQKLIKSYETDGKAVPNDSVLEREAHEELVCDMLSRMFADKNAYDKLMELKQKDLNTFQKLGQAIKKVIDRIAKIIGVYDTQTPDFMYAASAENFGEEAFRQLQDLYMRAFVKADENYQTAEVQKNTTDEGGVKYSIDYNDAIDQLYAGTLDRTTNTHLKVLENTPQVYIDKAGAKDLKIIIGWDIAYLAMNKSGDLLGNYHSLGPDVMKAMPQALKDPLYIIKQDNGRIIAVTEVVVKGNRSTLVSIELDAFKSTTQDGELEAENYNLIVTIFDAKANYLQKLMSSGEIVHNKNNEDPAHFILRLKSLKKALSDDDHAKSSNEDISQEDEKVKTESAEAVDLEVDAKTESVAPKVLNSERTWTESDYVQERDKAAKEIASAIGVSVKKAKAYIDSVNSIAKMIAEDRVRLDYFSSPGRSSFVGNVEYGGSFDFSTLCKKRRLLTGTFTAIQKALPNTALTANEILDIRNRMKDAGLEVSCGLCYVEGSRANMGQFAKEFLNLYKKYYPDAWQPNMADVNTPEGIEWVRINHPECYEQYEYFWNHYGTLKEGDSNLFASQQKPKLYQLHTEYKGEILDKFNDDENVEEKNLNGGIRLQSFSDFEIVHLIDTMQIIMDMSRVGLAGQAYTKVPDFAWALGDTGLKINLSLIAKGVDANGKLIFDDVEGMPINDAMKLRDRYSKNVGTILVAFNDEQLLAAMADERVDYIIPFHRSQWKKSQYGAMGLPAKTKDYTYMQNEKFINPQYHEYRGRMVKDKATNYMPNEYWDFSKSGKENAEAYLEMCARNNKRPKFYKLLKNNGDGSYSLKDDGSTDGYWKLLIDFKMYDNDGVGSPQTSVKPEFNMDEATRMLNDYSGGHSNFPVAQGVVDSFVQEYKDSHKGQKFSERDNAPTFYSQMAKVVDGVKQDKLGATSVISMLRGKGVKAEEIKWSGIETFLEGKKSVTKAELQEFIAGSQLNIEEEVLDGRKKYTGKLSVKRTSRNNLELLENGKSVLTFTKDDGGWKLAEKDMYFTNKKDILNWAKEESSGNPRWKTYTLPGGTNYRNILLKMPGSTYTNAPMWIHWGRKDAGILAHARFQDFNADGKKMLFVEEIQSDWHNEGHKQGYKVEGQKSEQDLRNESGKAYREFIESDIVKSIETRLGKSYYEGNVTELISDLFDGDSYALDEITYNIGELTSEEKAFIEKTVSEEAKRQKEISNAPTQKKMERQAPDAPFKDNYHEYVMKRLLRMAAEEGYDSIGWTTGDIQSFRYSREFAEGYRIEYDQDIPKFMKKYGKQWGAEVSKTEIITAEGFESVIDKNGMQYEDDTEWKLSLADNYAEGSYEHKNLSNGKAKTVERDGTLYIELPNGKLLAETATGNRITETVWKMDITPAMKDSVLHEGQPLYSERTEESVSNRSLLANALESAAQNDIERNKIQEYKGKIDLINAEEQKLSELKEQIKELSFAKGPRDTKKIRDLQFEANQTANRISTYDKQLLRLEASKPLQDVLTREKKMAYKRAEQKGKEALAAYREKATKTQREMLERYQESRKKAVESREKTVVRHKIQSVVGELNQLLLSNDKKRHVPDSLKKAVADALSLVNMDTVGAEERAAKYAALIAKETDPDKIDAYTMTMENILRQGEKMGQRLKELRDAYEEIQNSDDPDIANAYDPVIAGSLQELSQSIGNTSLRNMTIEQMQDVYDMYRMVLTRVRDANKSLINSIKETIANRASRVVGEVKRVGGEHKYRTAALDFFKKFGWDNMKPVYAFEHIGSAALTDAFNQVRAGEDTWAVDVKEARDYYMDKSNKYGYDSWDFKKKYRFQSTSETEFELTLEQILSLYAYSKREQAHDHLRLGGFVFDSNIETYKEKDGKSGKSILKYKVNTADAHQITPEILAKITGTLTKEQMAFVDEMQDYLSTVMGAKGNEITMKMYGVKLFKEKFYFPLKSAKQFMFEQNEVSGEVRIKNSGFTNKVVAKANNPVILNNFMDVWANHVNDMAMYHSFVLPLEDFNRIFNYNSPKQEGQPPVSVKGTIQNAYSPAAVNYVRQLITDLNGGARSDSTTGFINKMIGLFKKGAVFASLSVTIQQTSAIARATALIDPKYFIGPKVDHKRHKALWEEVKQYAPVAIIKEMGYFDTNMGKSTQDYITSKEYSGFKDKMKAVVTDSNYRDEVFSKAPSLADEIAWCGIWEAVKRETKANNPGMDVKSEAFLKKTGERFTEVITKTQVYDSVLSRSGLMRSKDTGMKMATSFMAEPTTSINMVADALLQGKRGNRKYARSAIGAVIASQILNSILVSFVYAGRDDDEDETYLEKYVGTFTGEMLDSLNPATYIPFIKDIVSIVQGYDVERSDMSVISDLWKAYENLSKDNVSAYRKVEGFAGSIAQIFGLPVKNIMRDVRGIYQTVDSFVNGEQTTAAGVGYAIKGAVTGKTESDGQQLYEAYLNGDTAHIARVKARFEDQTAINTAIRKALRENDPRIREAAIAWNANDLDEYMRIAKEIIAEKHFVQDDVVSAIRSEASALSPDGGASPSKEKGLFTAEKFAEAIAQGDRTTANAAKDDIIQTAVKNGKTEEEAEKSFISSAKTELKDQFVDGGISEKQAINALKTYCQDEDDPMDDDDIYWLIKKWDYEKETGSSDGYGKYNDFHSAVQTGKNLKAVIKEYTDHGVEAKTLASQITSYFKPLYKEMSNYERASIKGYLLNAYVMLGYNRTEKSKDIDKWIKD